MKKPNLTPEQAEAAEQIKVVLCDFIVKTITKRNEGTASGCYVKGSVSTMWGYATGLLDYSFRYAEQDVTPRIHEMLRKELRSRIHAVLVEHDIDGVNIDCKYDPSSWPIRLEFYAADEDYLHSFTDMTERVKNHAAQKKEQLISKGFNTNAIIADRE